MDRCANSHVRSLIEHYPNFNTNLRASLRSLVGEAVETRVDIGMAKDGSGVGGTFFLPPSSPMLTPLRAPSCAVRPPSYQTGTMIVGLATTISTQ